ncbi:hypothetical protein TraAM80_07799, partial [Trypanosoma rangeli]
QARVQDSPGDERRSKRGPSSDQARAHEYPGEEEHSKRGPSSDQARVRDSPGDERHAKKKASFGRPQAHEYPGEEEHADGDENVRGDVVGRQGGEGNAAQRMSPGGKGAESNVHTVSFPEHPIKGEQKSEDDHNVGGIPESEHENAGEAGDQQREGVAGRNLAASTKPPRAARSTLPDEGPIISGGKLQHPGIPSGSLIGQPLSTAQPERDQGDKATLRRGVTPLGDDTQLPSQQLHLPKVIAVRQPWFPAGLSQTEDHIPLDKRESFIHRADSIKDLERRSRESLKNSGHNASRHNTPRE